LRFELLDCLLSLRNNTVEFSEIVFYKLVHHLLQPQKVFILDDFLVSLRTLLIKDDKLLHLLLDRKWNFLASPSEISDLFVDHAKERVSEALLFDFEIILVELVEHNCSLVEEGICKHLKIIQLLEDLE
jgi:hypothetical protein